MSPETPVIASPRLAALQKELEGGNEAALSLFWEEMAKNGAPLLEHLENEPKRLLATFVWKADEELKNVLFASHLTGYDMQKGLMSKMHGSSLWYISLKIDPDLRTTYQFAPNDSLVPLNEEKDILGRIANLKPDPFNPHRFDSPVDEEDPGGPQIFYSVLEMPQASPQPWCTPRPGMPAGKVEKFRLASKLLANERNTWLYTPPGYVPDGKPYPLLVVFDGFAYTQMVNIPVLLDNLLADGLIPPFVAVFPNSLNMETRSLELPCHAPFADFLVEELLPWVRQKAHITDDPSWTFVGGSSYGGLASSYAAFRHPEAFENVISQSGSYWWKPEDAVEDEWLTRQLALAPRLPLRFYLDVGLLETSKITETGPNHRLSNRHMRDVLEAKGYPVTYVEYNGGHDYIWWQGTLADGLLALLKGRKWKSIWKGK